MITSAPNGPIAALVFSVDLGQTLLIIIFFWQIGYHFCSHLYSVVNRGSEYESWITNAKMQGFYWTPCLIVRQSLL